MLATVLHLQRGTPYVYQGEELGMTNAPLRLDRRLPRHRVAATTTPRRSRAGDDPGGVLAALRTMGRDNARTPMQWDASEHAGFTTGDAVDRGQPEPRGDQRRGRSAPTPTPCSTTTARLIALRHSEPVVAHGDFTMLLAGPRAGLRVHAPPRAARSCSCSANLSGEPADVELPPGWAGAELLLANVAEPGDGGALAPWEARIHRRGLLE